jgi:hypothetical protein
MKTRMTGGSGLSRKLLTVMALCYATMSGAQSSIATGPNKVYIEQVGTSNTITIQQVGGTNNVGGVAVDALTVDSTGLTTLTPTAPSATNYGTVSGSSNQLAITQTGSANSAQYSIRGSNNVYTSTVTGNSNKTKLDIGDVSNATNLRNTVTETINGNSNIVIQNIIGNDIDSTTTINTGNSNEITKELKSTNGTSILEINGNNNVINAQQIDSAGANGHYLKNVILGSFNSITTQQQGSNDTTIDMRTDGSHNTITVRTSSGIIASPATAIAR